MAKDNLKVYNKLKEVPEEAKKTIGAGRLKGFTDINPMWRIKALTEQFGACGEGWYYEVLKKETFKLPTMSEPKEIIAVVDIALYYMTSDGWSKPVFGTGGSKMMAQERNGAYMDDECFKKALTDAIGVASKALGLGADVYWDKDSTKYTEYKKQTDDEMSKTISTTEQKTLTEYAEKVGSNVEGICQYYKVNSVAELTKGQYGQVMATLMGREQKKGGKVVEVR